MDYRKLMSVGTELSTPTKVTVKTTRGVAHKGGVKIKDSIIEKLTKKPEEKKGLKQIKDSATYKSVKNTLAERIKLTDSTDGAIECALCSLNEGASCEEVIAAVVETLGNVIDILTAQVENGCGCDNGLVDEEFDSSEITDAAESTISTPTPAEEVAEPAEEGEITAEDIKNAVPESELVEDVNETSEVADSVVTVETGSETIKVDTEGTPIDTPTIATEPKVETPEEVIPETDADVDSHSDSSLDELMDSIKKLAPEKRKVLMDSLK